MEIDTAPTITAAAAQVSREPRAVPAAGSATGTPAIAVLDFANVTHDPDTAWLSAGIGRSRPLEAGLVRGYRLAAEGRIDESVRELVTRLNGAPRGFTGWTLPIEPLLDTVRDQGACGPVEHALAQRDG